MGHPMVAYLLSMAVGYWVLTLADKQNGKIKTLGQVLAGIIIVVSLLGPICKAASALCCHNGAAGYSQSCPFTGGWRHEGMGGSCMTSQCPTDGKMDMKAMTPGDKKMDKDKGTKDAK